MPNGVVESRQYNTVNQLELLKTVKYAAKGQEITLTCYRYTLDKVGNHLSMTDQIGRKVEYDYDELYRLEQEKVTESGFVTRTTDFSYDNVGNRLSQTETANGIAKVTTYQYDANDRLEQGKVNNLLKTSYQYDANGNTIAKTETGAGTTTYDWNQDGRLTDAQTANGKAVSYTYDSEGIRTRSTVDGVTTDYLVDKNRDYAQVLEERINGDLTVNYIYGLNLISQERSSQISFYLVDGLGSTTGLVSATGDLTDTYTYEAFGATERQTGGTENSYLFAGEQLDQTLGNYYLRQRYYNTESGRFARADSYEGKYNEPLTLHKYIYGNDNPVAFVDPSGYSSIQEGNDVHNAIGFHFLTQATINPIPWINPMSSSGLFTNSRVFDPRPPINIGQKRPTYRRIIRTATGNPQHSGVRSINRQIPDLADFSAKELYEIKPNISSATIDAQNKLTNAEIGLSSVGLTGWSRGSTYAPPAIVPVVSSGNFAIIKYASPGVLVYDVLNTRLTLQALRLSTYIMQQAISQLIGAITAASARSQTSGGFA